MPVRHAIRFARSAAGRLRKTETKTLPHFAVRQVCVGFRRAAIAKVVFSRSPYVWPSVHFDVGLSDACITALVVPYVAPAGVREALMDGIAAEWARQCSNLWRFSSRGVIGCPHSHAVSPVPISYAMYLARLVGDNDRCGGA